MLLTGKYVYAVTVVAPASSSLAAAVHAGAGAMAGGLATLATQPFDVIKVSVKYVLL